MKIYDSVHGFIHFNELERALIDTESFQRLHYIHQLGVVYLVYPGATHTRFEHSLGTMTLATRIFDQIASEDHRIYWRQMVRLAALCHDLGHLPFSHVAEKLLLGRGGHEEWTLKIIESEDLEPIWKMAQSLFPGFPIKEDAVKLALGEEKLKSLRPHIVFTPWERVYSQIITGDFFGADRIDYLLRDAKASGLSYGLFDYGQLIEMLTVFSEREGNITIGIKENGVESCEALLLARHFMQRRIYQYPAAKSYSFHLARFMKLLYRNSSYFQDVKHYISMTEYEVLSALKRAREDVNHPGHLDALAFWDREKRFQAIALPEKIQLENLVHFKAQRKIPDLQMEWDLENQGFFKEPSSFPVLRKNNQIISLSQLSEIMVPLNKKNWLYLAPEFSFEI